MKNEANRVVTVAQRLLDTLPKTNTEHGTEYRWIAKVVKHGCEAYLRLGKDFKTPIHEWLLAFRKEKSMWNSMLPTELDWDDCEDAFFSSVNVVFRNRKTGEATPDKELLTWIYLNIVFAAQVGSVGYAPIRRYEYVVSALTPGFYMGGGWNFKGMKCNKFEGGKRPEQPIKI